MVPARVVARRPQGWRCGGRGDGLHTAVGRRPRRSRRGLLARVPVRTSEAAAAAGSGTAAARRSSGKRIWGGSAARLLLRFARSTILRHRTAPTPFSAVSLLVSVACWVVLFYQFFCRRGEIGERKRRVLAYGGLLFHFFPLR
jgi:hypothetical protein